MEIYDPSKTNHISQQNIDADFLDEIKDDKPYSFLFSLKLTVLLNSKGILMSVGVLALILFVLDFLFFFYSYAAGGINQTHLLYDISISFGAVCFILLAAYLFNTFRFFFNSRKRNGIRARIYKEGILFASDSTPMMPQLELKKTYEEFLRVYCLKEAYLFVTDYAYKRKMVFIIF